MRDNQTECDKIIMSALDILSNAERSLQKIATEYDACIDKAVYCGDDVRVKQLIKQKILMCEQFEKVKAIEFFIRCCDVTKVDETSERFKAEYEAVMKRIRDKIVFSDNIDLYTGEGLSNLDKKKK